MMNNNDNNNKTTQLTVSHELLLLLRWFVLHEEEKFKKIILKASRSGLYQEIQNLQVDFHDPHDLEHSITDFFNMLEILLQESTEAQTDHQAHQKKLMPTVDKVDGLVCDKNTIRSSLEKTTVHLENNPKADGRDILLLELLKNWKPNNRIVN